MTIFPYVYPYLDQEEFLAQADIVVGLFLAVFLLALAIPTIIAIVQLSKKPKRHPVFQDQINTAEEEKDARSKWLEAPPKGEKKFGNIPEEEKLEDELDEPAQDLKPVVKGGLNTENSESSDSDDSDPSEEETESDTSNDDNEGNPDDYANLKRIPAADVNLDTGTGFGTGMSGLREAKIQQFRQQEKRLM